jgi:glycosyltransferase involved in cell wall biosynthesis
MVRLTGLIHTHDDGARLGRTLESLRPCDDLIVVDHGSSDDTLRVAREYGARLVPLSAGGSDEVLRASEWILSVLPTEALTEGLEAALYEWKLGNPRPEDAFAVDIREERDGEWSPVGVSTRLVSRIASDWRRELPPARNPAALLDGILLRFLNP